MMPLNIFTQNWSVLLTFGTTLILGFVVYLQATAEYEYNKKKIIIVTSMVGLLASLVAAVVSLVTSINQDKQQQQLQSNILAAKNLGIENEKLSKQIQTLQEVNNEIARGTQNIAVNTQAMTSQGQQSIGEIKAASTELKTISKNIYNEQTGSTSIPLVSSEIISTTSDTVNNKIVEKLKLKFSVKNIGDISIPVTQFFVARNLSVEDDLDLPWLFDLKKVMVLAPDEEVELDQLFDVGDIIDSSKNGFGRKFNPAFHLPITYNIRVRSKYWYNYYVSIEKPRVIGELFHVDNWFEYKGKRYDFHGFFRLIANNKL